MVFLILGVSLVLTTFVLFMQRRWRGSGQRAILIVHEGGDEVRRPLTLMVIDADEEQATLVPLPTNWKVPAAVQYGSYASDALVGLTQLEQLHWRFLLLTLGLDLGVTIDDIVWTSKPPPLQLTDVRAVVGSTLLNRSYTTLMYWDRWRLWWQLQRIAEYHVQTADMAAMISSETGELDSAALERSAARLWQDRQIRQSEASVVILNASGQTGLANRTARALELAGYYVRNVETAPEEERSTVYRTSEVDKDESKRWARQRLELFLEKFDAKVDQERTQRARADFVIVIGKDIATLYKGK